MDFIGGALPNVMFLVGVIAIGIGLGLEFRIVEIKNDLGKGGRFGAFGIGAVLIATSIFLYTRPDATTSAPVATPVAQPAAALVNVAASPVATAALAAVVASATPVPQVSVPEIRGKSERDAGRILEQAGLRRGVRRNSCEELAMSGKNVKKVKKNQIACQSVLPKTSIAAGTAIDYVIPDD